MSNAIGSSRELNPARMICHLRAVPLGHVADAVPLGHVYCEFFFIPFCYTVNTNLVEGEDSLFACNDVIISTSLCKNLAISNTRGNRVSFKTFSA